MNGHIELDFLDKEDYEHQYTEEVGLKDNIELDFLDKKGYEHQYTEDVGSITGNF